MSSSQQSTTDPPGQAFISTEFKNEIERNRDRVEDLFKFEDQKVGRGTYGHVYKAINKQRSARFPKEIYALKSIDVNGPSSWREIMILREVKHPNLVSLHGVFIMPDRKVYLVLEYAEHDLWHIIKHNRQAKAKKSAVIVPQSMVKSILYQVLEGMHYLHANWILHRDLKPANILVMGEGPAHERGRVKIADLGFARTYDMILKPMIELDPVVVTFWYRSPELLLGAKHYSTQIDVWAIGCIFAELITAEPLFICKEEDLKAQTPYHYEQMHKIFSVMGYPTKEQWSYMTDMPLYPTLLADLKAHGLVNGFQGCSIHKYLENEKHRSYMNNTTPGDQQKLQIDLLKKLLTFDPIKRVTCKAAMQHEYFKTEPKPQQDVFYKTEIPYPAREMMQEAEKKTDPNMNYNPTFEPKRMRYGQEDSFPAPHAPAPPRNFMGEPDPNYPQGFPGPMQGGPMQGGPMQGGPMQVGPMQGGPMGPPYGQMNEPQPGDRRMGWGPMHR